MIHHLRGHPPAIDIEDLNYSTTSEALGILNYRVPAGGKRGTLKSMAYFLAKIVRSVLIARKKPNWKSLKGKGVLIGLASANQASAVEPIIGGLQSVGVLSLNKTVPGARFPEWRAYIRSLPYIRHVLLLKSRAEGYKKIGYEFYLDRYLLTYGYFHTAIRVLDELGPEILLLSNDHNMDTRTLQHAATHLGIQTAYLQHASVTQGFPPLSFTVAFLDGEDAARKYDLPASQGTQVFLTGTPKADTARRKRRERTRLESLGICVNELDPMDSVVSFIEDLRTLRPELRIVLRPHPRDTRDWDVTSLQVTTSDSLAESSFEFLDRVDGIVTGPSNIALEAALVNVRPVFKDFGHLGRDHYGFIASGLCQEVSTASEALETLNPDLNRNSVSTVLKQYCSTVSTTFDGRSSELVQQLILELLNGGVNLERWRRRTDFDHIEVYELNL